ncbi:MAG: ribosome maturation factor RimM [Caulobacterales bacterium]
MLKPPLQHLLRKRLLSKFVLVGVIDGAFGVHGEARVRAFTSAPENLFAYGPLLDAEGRVVLTPRKWRAISDGIAVTAPEIKSREHAMEMRGTRLYASRDQFPPADDEDEFYVVDLIGCAVEDVSGEARGEVIAVHDFGAGDILEIKPSEGHPFFVEFSHDAVPHVRLSERRLVIDPPPEFETGEEAENEE